MGFTTEHLRRAAAALADKAEAAAEELNGQDAKLGDGDLGITVSKGWREVSGLLAGARDAMMARGRGNLGDKSLLDVVDATARETVGLDEPAALLAAADRATDEALEAYRERPNKLGRARMFGEKSIGLDDPGMLAFRRLLDGLKS